MDWTGVGPTVGPITGGFYYLCFLVRTRPIIFNCVLFSTFLVGPWGPFLVIRVYLTYCILSTLNLVPSIFMYVMFYQLRLFSFWDVTFMVTERSTLRSVDLGVHLVFSVSFWVVFANSCLIKSNQVFSCVPVNYGTIP